MAEIVRATHLRHSASDRRGRDRLIVRCWITRTISGIRCAGNLALLLLLGLLGPVALPFLGRWWRIARVALLYSVAIEVIQLAVPDRSADIDDVIVNVAGALLGYAAFLIVRSGLRPRAAPA